MPVYLGIAAVIHFAVTFLLLQGTDRMWDLPSGGGRLAAAALLSALYSGACLLPGLQFLQKAPCRIIHMASVCSVGFGLGREAFQKGAVFLLLSMAVGSLAAAAPERGMVTLACAAGLWLLMHLAFEKGPRLVPVEIREGEKKLSLTALWDTGNCLLDPISGEPVLVVGREQARELTGLSEKELEDPYETLKKRRCPGLMLIPYQVIGKERDMLLGKRFRRVRIGKKYVSRVVAFAPEGMEGQEYQAIMGGQL